MSMQSIKALEACGVKITATFTHLEANILDALVSRRNSIVSKRQLTEYVWPNGESPASNSIEVMMSRIRKKLSDPTVVRTFRGQGYLFEPPDVKAEIVNVAEEPNTELAYVPGVGVIREAS